jgi:preprotein translocase subunit SecB
MSHADDRVSSGYEILQVYALEQHYEVVAEVPEGVEESPGTEEPLGVNWDWRIIEGRDFEVQLGLEMPPTAELHELLRVRFVLRARAGENLSISPANFVRGPAISVLIPYLREAITSLSARGPIGVRYLNPLNANSLAAQFSFEGSFGGRQLSEDPELAAIYAPENEHQPSEG